MRLADLDNEGLRRQLHTGLSLDLGLIRVRLRSDITPFAEALQQVYGEYPLGDAADFHDVDTVMRPVHGGVQFRLDGEHPFEALPAGTHLPMWEWGLNYCIAGRCHRHLLLHAGVVARDDRALLIPALPGSGKSTLTAALSCRGYRLLSDEFAAIRVTDRKVLPVVRPICLKNESVPVMADFAPQAAIGPLFRDTRKGDVAHLAPDAASVAARHRPARPGLILFPQYRAGAPAAAERIEPALAFVKLTGNSFNYELLGASAFDTVRHLVESCPSYALSYGDLDAALRLIEELSHDAPR